jgi:hypothetical protein
MAFTDFGIETLAGLVVLQKGKPSLRKRVADPNQLE